MVHCYNSFLRKSPFSFLRSYFHYRAPVRKKNPFSVITHIRVHSFLSIYTDTNARYTYNCFGLARETQSNGSGVDTHAPTHVDIHKYKKQCVWCKHEKLLCTKEKWPLYDLNIYRSIHLSSNNFKYFLLYTLFAKNALTN